MNRNTTIFASSFVLSISLVVSSVVISNASSSPVIKACAVKKTGDLRVITGKAKCKKTERLVTWGIKGSTGARGLVGARGPAGAPAIPNVTVVDNTEDGWTSIYTGDQSSWESVSLMQSEPLAAGNYLVLANIEISTGSGRSFCAATTTENSVGYSGSYRSVPPADTPQALSFSRYVSVEEGQSMHLRCAGTDQDAVAVNGIMTLVPVS
jgi:hypothetical protein